MNYNAQPDILIVDDTPANLELLGGMLKQKGYKVRAALNGNLALQAARNLPPDLILLDVNMPGMDGYEVCRYLKSDSTLHTIPVIFISAYNETPDKLRAFSSGGVDYITKPFQLDEVLARVDIHLQLTHIGELKREIAERKQTQEMLVQSLQEKETLIRELYHRTKNTLQVMISMLLIQANDYPGNEELQSLVKKTEHRVRVISLVHQMLYQSNDLSRISIRQYINKLAELILESFDIPEDKVTLKTEIHDQYYVLDTAIPLGMILNELVTNSLKYAFPGGRKGEICITLKNENSVNTLNYMDNGAGVPAGFDFRKQETLGLKLIHNIGELQMTGHVAMFSNSGVSCLFEFPDNLYSVRV
jgi:two-component sensor histidine kinase